MTVKVAPEFWVNQGPATDTESAKLHTTAAAFRRMLDGMLAGRQGVIYTRGVCNDLRVLASAVADVNITVKAGACYVRGTQATDQGMYHVYNDADLVIPLLTNNPANPTNPRIDLVVARMQDQQYSGAVDLPTIEMVTGTPAASPAVPAAPANSLILAQILVGAAVSTITQANITDRRVPAGNGVVVLDDILVGTDPRYLTQAAATQIDFLNSPGATTNLIPPGFSDLEIITDSRSDGAVTAEVGLLQFNTDANVLDYVSELLDGINATAAASQAFQSASGVQYGVMPGASSTAGTSGVNRILIPQYSSPTFHKNVLCSAGTWDNNTTGSGRSYAIAGRWLSTAPIIRITAKPTSGTHWAVGSRFLLLGHVGIQP